jgi:hypothetical protein
MGGSEGIERDRFHTHRLITRARIGSHEKLLLFVLWDFENSRTGNSWPMLATLVAASGLSERSVCYALRALTARQVLSGSRRFNRSTVRGINYDALALLAQPQPQPVQSQLQPVQPQLQPVQSQPHQLQTNRRRTQEEKKSEHAPTLLSKRDGKGPKARADEDAFRERMRAVAIRVCAERAEAMRAAQGGAA